MIIHTAWVGPNPIPDDFKANMATQQKFAKRWCFWTPQRVQNDARVAWVMDTPYFKSCMAAKHYSAACDLLRYALLYAMGGMWCDGDVEVIKAPGAIFQYGPEDHVHAGYEDDGLLGMAVVCGSPQHPLLGRLLDVYRTLTYANLPEGGGDTNGPTIFTHAVREWMAKTDRDPRVTLHPTETFYPSSWRTPDVVNVTDRTVAWHKWAASWRATADLTKWKYK